MIGTVLNGTYRLEARIGRGGMGTVYRASHVRIPRHFAIKMLEGGPRAQDDGYKRFRREAEIVASLEHPNIVEAIDFNETEEGLPYYVMPLLEGEDVGARLRARGELPLDSVIAIVAQVARGLAAAHARGIVHRDVKPQNIFLQRTSGGETAKILDFGVSKIVGASSALTANAAIVGTPNYIAPEQTRGARANVDARADQFALAATAIEMISGHRAFEQRGDDPLTVLRRVANEPPFTDGVPDCVLPALERALCKSADGRFRDVTAFADAFAAAAAGASRDAGARAGIGRTARHTRRPRSRRVSWMIAALAAVALAGAVLLVRARLRASAPPIARREPTHELGAVAPEPRRAPPPATAREPQRETRPTLAVERAPATPKRKRAPAKAPGRDDVRFHLEDPFDP